MTLAMRELPKVGELVHYTIRCPETQLSKQYPAIVLDKNYRSKLILRVFYEEGSDILQEIDYSQIYRVGYWSFRDTESGKSTMEKLIEQTNPRMGCESPGSECQMSSYKEMVERYKRGRFFPLRDCAEPALGLGAELDYPIGIQYIYEFYIHTLHQICVGQIKVVKINDIVELEFHCLETGDSVILNDDDKFIGWTYATQFYQHLKQLAKTGKNEGN